MKKSVLFSLVMAVFVILLTFTGCKKKRVANYLKGTWNIESITSSSEEEEFGIKKSAEGEYALNDFYAITFNECEEDSCNGTLSGSKQNLEENITTSTSRNFFYDPEALKSNMIEIYITDTFNFEGEPTLKLEIEKRSKNKLEITYIVDDSGSSKEVMLGRHKSGK